MSEGFLIILVELVLVLLIGGGFLLFKAHKKREGTRNQVAGLFKKFANETPNRKEKLSFLLKDFGFSDDQVEESVSRLVGAEKICITAFASAQLTQAQDDIAFFSDVVYDLSAVHMDIMSMVKENVAAVASAPLDSVALPEVPPASGPAVIPEPEEDYKAEGGLSLSQDDDDIEVSLDLDDLEELDKPEELDEISDLSSSDGEVLPKEDRDKDKDIPTADVLVDDEEGSASS